MESKHIDAADAPALARRRRKVARQSRDKTPEARMLGTHNYSDDDEDETTSSTHDQQREQHRHQRRSTSSRSSKTPPLSPNRHEQNNNDNKITSKTPPLSPTRNPIESDQKLRKSLSPVAREQNRTSPAKQILTPPTPPVRRNSPAKINPLTLSSSPSRTDASNTAPTPPTDDDNIQTIRMQIRPPASQHIISAHESKILRRRNKQFAGQAARSQSQPRAKSGGVQSSPDVKDLMRSAKRSLSSTRHTDETDESGQSTTYLQEYSPLPDLKKKLASGNNTIDVVDDEKISKLEKNLKKFDEERRKFEVEKKKFERERRDIHKLRYRQMVEAEERKKMLENYRKNSGDSSELLKLIPKISQSFREPKTTENTAEQKPSITVRRSESNRRSKTKNYESSTVSESDSENVRAEMIEYRKTHQRRVNRAPPPPPPPPPSSTQGSIQTQSTDTTTTENQQVIRRSSISPIRKRKFSKPQEEIKDNIPIESKLEENLEKRLSTTGADEKINENIQKPGIIARLISKFKKSKAGKLEDAMNEEIKSEDDLAIKKYSFTYIKMIIKELRLQWVQFKQDHQREIIQIRLERNRCIGNFILLAMLLGFGGLAFRFTEGNTDGVYKCEVKKVKRDFIDQLWMQSHSMREEDWKSQARNRLRTFEEELYTVYDTGPTSSYAGLKAWSFINSIIYCWTIVTQIGYGHIAPKTTLGQGITIVYAIFGIPIFLILLADFGKLFTRGIKFIWAYVRRVYYTGTCRKVRKSQQMQDVMKGVNTVYDVAIRRPSQFIRDVDIENESEAPDTIPETPTSPYPETLEIDDDFNLPVSVATVVLVCYIIVGAFVYPLWEVKWSYFEAFYFVFISMSTIGFGDYVPDHPIFMMLSTVYLVFGLALTSMFINVVQIKLSDSFRQASAKIGATIGFSMTEEELSKHSQLGTPIPPTGLNNIPEENDLDDKEVRNITGPPKIIYNLDPNATPPLLPRQPRIPPEEPKKKKSFF